MEVENCAIFFLRTEMRCCSIAGRPQTGLVCLQLAEMNNSGYKDTMIRWQITQVLSIRLDQPQGYFINQRPTSPSLSAYYWLVLWLSPITIWYFLDEWVLQAVLCNVIICEESWWPNEPNYLWFTKWTETGMPDLFLFKYDNVALAHLRYICPVFLSPGGCPGTPLGCWKISSCPASSESQHRATVWHCPPDPH